MKKYVSVILMALAANCAFAQTYPLKMTLKVVGEDGNPIAGAKAGVGYYTHSQPAATDGLTDTNGIFVVEHSVKPNIVGYSLGFEAEKSGYYSANQNQLLPPTYSPEKWNQTVTLVLKKVGNPIAMYAKQNLQMVFPEYNKAIGYDLEIGDWVAPYGKGINTDLFFTEAHTSPQSGYIISVSFSNIGDGIQEFTVPDAEKGSALRSEQEAPTDGYQSTASQTQTTNPKRNFYFRVHTKLDENGNIVSARYGKIYGDLAQFTYYYNPTPNDRSMEFDPKQNLIHGSRSYEQVSQP